MRKVIFAVTAALAALATVPADPARADNTKWRKLTFRSIPADLTVCTGKGGTILT